MTWAAARNDAVRCHGVCSSSPRNACRARISRARNVTKRKMSKEIDERAKRQSQQRRRTKETYSDAAAERMGFGYLLQQLSIRIESILRMGNCFVMRRHKYQHQGRSTVPAPMDRSDVSGVRCCAIRNSGMLFAGSGGRKWRR